MAIDSVGKKTVIRLLASSIFRGHIFSSARHVSFVSQYKCLLWQLRKVWSEEHSETLAHAGVACTVDCDMAALAEGSKHMNEWMKIYIWRVKNFHTKIACSQHQMHIVHKKKGPHTHTHTLHAPPILLPATLKQASTLSHAHTHTYVKNPRMT